MTKYAYLHELLHQIATAHRIEHIKLQLSIWIVRIFEMWPIKIEQIKSLK